MKWSKAWDYARFNGAPWTSDVWYTNEWNGMVAGGSGTAEQCKIIWVGTDLVIMDQRISDGQHLW